jgi:hypothetical protein
MKTLFSYLAIAILLTAASCGGGDKKDDTKGVKHKYVRYNVNTPKGQKALAAMQVAFDSMRKMDCSNVLSWYYQGSIHWIPDTVKDNKLCASYSNKSELKKAWDNCTHTAGSDINFLSWHRLYIWHLEEIVRKLSGDPEFALPYWGYTDTTDTIANRTMNKMFRDPNSLFEKSRFEPLNSGVPLNGAIIQVLDTEPLMEEKDVAVFTTTLDNGIHGAMHNYIGGGNGSPYKIFNPIYNCDCYNNGPNNDTCDGGLMRNVPSAGYDPIFFMHHSNVDRLWQQWTNSPNGKLLTAEDLNSFPWPYVFFNADGKEISYTTDEVLAAIYNVDYEYDDTPTPPAEADTVKPKKQPSVLLSAKRFADTVVSQKIGKVMKGSTMSFSVKNDSRKMTTLLKDAAAANKPKTVMVIMKVSFSREPKGIYQVYINLPKGAPYDIRGNYFAGFMTFFGARHHALHMTDGTTATGLPTKTFQFEMTDEFAATNGAEAGNYDISIINKSGEGLADITIESVSVITK